MKNWTTDAIFYHIYPLGFCGCEQYNQPNTTSRILKLKDWIPHLKEMNINALYLGPVFESYEHGYDTSDYQLIDHRLGTNADFRCVCDALHEAGIHIVLDGVFNHVGRNFWAFQDVIKNREQSAYCSWFYNLNFYGNNPMNDGFTYDTWEGHYNLVKLNLQNEDVIQYLLQSVAMWMDDFHIDGLRLDAADCVDPNFFKRLKAFCKEKNPDFWLMGEIIHGDYNRWANPDMLDSVTNYECYKGLYSSHNEKNYFEINYSLNRQFANQGGIYANLLLYNFVDNHDVNRLASTVKDEEDLMNIYTMLYAMPGIPSIYYGSEYGIKGSKAYGSDANLRPCLELDELEKENITLYKHICNLGKVYPSLEALHTGVWQQVVVRNQQLVFARKCDSQIVYALFNVSDEDTSISFTLESNCVIDALTNKQYTCKNQTFDEVIPRKSSMLLVVQDNTEIIEEVIKEEKTPVVNDKQDIVLETKEEKQTMVEEVKQHEECEEPLVLPAVKQVIPHGVYEHFKGKRYNVLYVAKHSENEEEYVVYRQLYGDGEVWIRPLSMFLETVEVDGEEVPRFRYIKP